MMLVKAAEAQTYHAPVSTKEGRDRYHRCRTLPQSPSIALFPWLRLRRIIPACRIELERENFIRKLLTVVLGVNGRALAAALEENGHAPLKDVAALLSEGFTQANAFDEAVRACEGVPRDIINILGKAAQRLPSETISVSGVRQAALQWYQGSKDPAVSAHAQAKRLLEWVVDKVIKEWQAKAFLLESGARDSLIDHLYDERVLHVLKKGMSSKDAPGTRYNVYGIDYRCYVDLINTVKAPQGLRDLGEMRPDFVGEVPKTDLRSIRRCILDLADFYAQESVLPA